jgi:hypothetical protein
MMKAFAESVGFPINETRIETDTLECEWTQRGTSVLKADKLYQAIETNVQNLGFYPVFGRCHVGGGDFDDPLTAMLAGNPQKGLLTLHEAVFERATNDPQFKAVVTFKMMTYKNPKKNTLSVLVQIVKR